MGSSNVGIITQWLYVGKEQVFYFGEPANVDRKSKYGQKKRTDVDLGRISYQPIFSSLEALSAVLTLSKVLADKSRKECNTKQTELLS